MPNRMLRSRNIRASSSYTALFVMASLIAAGCVEKNAGDGSKASSNGEHKTTSAVAPEHVVVDDGPPMRLYASKYVSKIRVAPSKDAPRIGYMRGGSVLMAKTG